MRSVRSKHLEDSLQEIMLKLHVEGSGGFRLSRWKGVGFCEGIPPSKGGKMEMKWTSCFRGCEESMSCVEEVVVGREWKSFGDLGQGQVLPKGGQWCVLRVSGSVPLWMGSRERRASSSRWNVWVALWGEGGGEDAHHWHQVRVGSGTLRSDNFVQK